MSGSRLKQVDPGGLGDRRRLIPGGRDAEELIPRPIERYPHGGRIGRDRAAVRIEGTGISEDLDALYDLRATRIDADEVQVAGVGPDLGRCDGQLEFRREPPDGGGEADRRDDRASGRVDLHERAVVQVHDPERVMSCGDRARAVADANSGDNLGGRRVDDGHRVRRDHHRL